MVQRLTSASCTQTTNILDTAFLYPVILQKIFISGAKVKIYKVCNMVFGHTLQRKNKTMHAGLVCSFVILY
jgi:hypothetical protein